MLADDLDLLVRPVDHRGVIGIDQSRLAVQVLDQVVVGLSAVDVRIHPDVDDEGVKCHYCPSSPNARASTLHRIKSQRLTSYRRDRPPSDAVEATRLNPVVRRQVASRLTDIG